MSWPGGSGRPSGLTKCDCLRPISFARLFIMATKPSTVPPMPSASAMQLSLPEATMTQRDQRLDRHVRADRHEAFRARALAPGALGDRQLVGELHPPVLEPLEQELERHQLAHRGRRHGDVGVLRPQHLAAVAVHDHGVLGIGADGGRGGGREKQQPEKDDAPHGCSYWSTTIWASLLPSPLSRANAASASAVESIGAVRTR